MASPAVMMKSDATPHSYDLDALMQTPVRHQSRRKRNVVGADASTCACHQSPSRCGSRGHEAPGHSLPVGAVGCGVPSVSVGSPSHRQRSPDTEPLASKRP